MAKSLKIKFIIALALCLAFIAFAAPLVGCAEKKDPKEIHIAASPIPHAEILRVVKPLLEAKGFKLKIKEVSGYDTMNDYLANGDVDANFFQHEAFMNEYMSQSGKKLTVLKKVFFEPYGVYKAKKDNLEDLTSTDEIAVPEDPSNAQRAYELLVANGVLEYNGTGDKTKKESYVTGTVGSFNPANIKTLEAQQVPSAFGEANMAVVILNGNVATEYFESKNQKKKDQVVVFETPEVGVTYANLVAVRSGDENLDKFKALVECFEDQIVKDFLATNRDGDSVSVLG